MAYTHTRIICIILFRVPPIFQTNPQAFNHILTAYFLFHPKRSGTKPSLEAAKQGESSTANPDECRSGRAWKATSPSRNPRREDTDGIFYDILINH